MSMFSNVSELPEEVAARLPAAEAHAHAAAAAAARDDIGAANRLLQTARRAPTAEKRVMWLRQAATAWAAPLHAHGACKRGCSHCCHIPVAMTDVEARFIGKAIGTAPRIPVGMQSAVEMLAADTQPDAFGLPGSPGPDAGYASPCPFLHDGECSIYENRPLACRTQVSLDVDDLLCRLRPGSEVPVPYADATMLKAFYVALQQNAGWADIRAFFPDGGRA